MLVEVTEAIKSRVTRFQDRVTISAEFKVLEDAGKMDLPAAYVIPLDDTANEQQSGNGYHQLVKDSFAVIVVLSNAVDELGKASLAQIYAIRSELCAALLSWKPNSEHGPIEYQGGQLLTINRGQAYYQFEFAAETEFLEADTWQGAENAGLPSFESLHIDVDAIDPHDPNIGATGPDGKIEVALDIDIPQ